MNTAGVMSRAGFATGYNKGLANCGTYHYLHNINILSVDCFRVKQDIPVSQEANVKDCSFALFLKYLKIVTAPKSRDSRSL